MRAFLRQAGITLLADEAVTLGNGVQLVGRKDPSRDKKLGDDRLSPEALLEPLDPARPVFVIDPPAEGADELAAAERIWICPGIHMTADVSGQPDHAADLGQPLRLPAGGRDVLGRDLRAGRMGAGYARGDKERDCPHHRAFCRITTNVRVKKTRKQV